MCELRNSRMIRRRVGQTDPGSQEIVPRTRTRTRTHSAANYSRSSDICLEIIGMRRVSNTCGRTKCPTDERRVKKSKRQLSVATVRIWQTTNDKEYKILKFKNDKSNSIQVRSYCDVCSYYSDYLRKWETFSDTWIEKSTNFKIRHSQDQQDEQHKRAI